MKKLDIIQGQYGVGFFDGDALIQYVHENDGDWRREYFNQVVEHFGITVRYMPEGTPAQNKAMRAQEASE